MLNLETIKEIDMSNLEYNDIYYDTSNRCSR